MSVRALGGGELAGDRLVRFVYLDESGTGNPRVEPWLIFAGVMVHEKVWKAVERRLVDLADSFALPEDRFGFVFHAQSLFTGGSHEFKEKYPIECRHDALEALCGIPRQFDLPVFMYGLSRAEFARRNPGKSSNDLLVEGLMHVSLACATGVERWMREHAEDGELATLVYEHNSDKNEGIREYHQAFRSDWIEEALKLLKPRRLMKFERIIETAMFSKKTESSLLQIADVCAYILGRRMRGVGLPDQFYRPIKQQLRFGLSRVMREAA